MPEATTANCALVPGHVVVATGCVTIVGVVLTVRAALLETIEEQPLVTTQEYPSASLLSMPKRVSVAVFAPEIWLGTSERLAFPFRHWYVGVGVPAATTEKLALVPAHCVTATGCVVMARELTLRNAEPLSTELHPVLTRHR